MRRRRKHTLNGGFGDEFDPKAAKTQPGGLPPLPVLAERDNGPAIDSGVRVADALDNLALKLHGYAQELRHEHGGKNIPWQRRKQVSEDLHGTADDVYPEGARSSG